jgi:hypothetical protein
LPGDIYSGCNSTVSHNFASRIAARAAAEGINLFAQIHHNRRLAEGFEAAIASAAAFFTRLSSFC